MVDEVKIMNDKNEEYLSGKKIKENVDTYERKSYKEFKKQKNKIFLESPERAVVLKNSSIMEQVYYDRQTQK